MREKEKWDYEKFVSAYNKHSDLYKSWHFILRNEEEAKDLEENYYRIDEIKTIAEYSETVYSCEQGEGADDLDLKYKQTKTGRPR